MRGDNSETAKDMRRSFEAKKKEAERRQKRNCERHAKKFRSVREDNSDTAKDMRRSFEAKKKEAEKREETRSKLSKSRILTLLVGKLIKITKSLIFPSQY